jgi:microcystin-dependent protein
VSSPFVAEIRIFPYNFAPLNWAFCQGQMLPISQNTALFSLLGTTYGGNGSTTFALPNLQGVVPMHFNQGPGLTPHVEGETGGSSTVTLNGQQMPAHAHTLQAFAGRGGSPADSPANSVLTPSTGVDVYDPGTGGTLSAMNPNAIALIGGGQPHNNLMPYLTLNFCIALTGIYPTRS